MRSFLLATALSATLLAASPVELHLPAYVVGAPGNMRVRISIERDDRNRWACFGWEGNNGNSKSSCWSIEGAAEQKTIYKNVVDLPAGDYLLVAWIIRSDEKVIKSVPQTLKVIGPQF